MFLRRLGRGMLHFIREYGIFLIILTVGLYIWVSVFHAALTDYLDSSAWNGRCAWLGTGDYQFWGFTITYQFEGYSDYSFFYVHWGNNFLRGVMPYTEEFGQIELDGITNSNGLYIFPPLYAILYAAGIALNLDGYWGIGLLLAIFGYLTVFPTYGIAKTLSHNKHVGEAAALTYLLSPNVLYHIDFIWLNTSPFIFFFFAGFFFLVRGHRHIGTLLIVTAALFKQMAWFLGLPLVVYLLTGPYAPFDRTRDSDELDKGKDIIHRLIQFGLSVILVLCYAGPILLPFLLTQPDMLKFMGLAGGAFPLESFTDPPPYGGTMRIQVLPVVAGLPELAKFLDYLVTTYFLITLGVVFFVGMMVIDPDRKSNSSHYFRRLLYLTMMMMLWVHLTGPRGVYKYYFTLFAPFFSIFSSGRMVTSKETYVRFSPIMVLLPLALSLLIVIPNRNVYLVGVLLIMIGYALVDLIGDFWFILTSPFRWLLQVLRNRIDIHRTIFSELITRVSRLFRRIDVQEAL
ncbi:MAG: hypothetical protein ACTSYL_00845 [Candidatus Thorarchaeota archaeon]